MVRFGVFNDFRTGADVNPKAIGSMLCSIAAFIGIHNLCAIAMMNADEVTGMLSSVCLKVEGAGGEDVRKKALPSLHGQMSSQPLHPMIMASKEEGKDGRKLLVGTNKSTPLTYHMITFPV